jgi:hypothetical protein
MIDSNSIHPIDLYKRMADALDEPECPDCNGDGHVDVDMGGGNTWTTFCSCAKGRELAEAEEKARNEKIYDS